MDTNQRVIELTTAGPMKLSAALEEKGVSFPMPCGGNGRCGKCAVQFLAGAPEAGGADRARFSEEELRNGWRLGCRAEVCGTCRVRVLQARQELEILSSFGVKEKTDSHASGEKGLGIGIDIGTTTIAMSLLDLASGVTVKTHTRSNPQRSFGADVLTRIQRANEGKAGVLSHSIREALGQGVEVLLRDIPEEQQVIPVAIAGNTAMLHLLLGYSCETLGRAPFTPVDLSLIEREISDGQRNFQVTVFPGISAFVGADIVSGIYALRMTEQKRPVLLLDLGTNGEMALWSGEKLYVTSTAAGPAFEGGNVKHGVPGIPGAISDVFADRGRIRVETIENAAPSGICGTGVISAIRTLRELGVLDETGTLAEPYLDEGYPLWIQSQRNQIRLYQEDIREIQMAKAAVHSGMELLLQETGTAPEQLEKIYLAGGMGYALKPEDAAEIGLIPREAAPRCEAVGNSALGGTLAYLRHPRKERLQEIVGKAEVISLANHPDFEELYLRYMNLD